LVKGCLSIFLRGDGVQREDRARASRKSTSSTLDLMVANKMFEYFCGRNVSKNKTVAEANLRSSRSVFLIFGMFISALLWISAPAGADVLTIRVPGETAVEDQSFQGVLRRNDIRLYQFLGSKNQTLTITFKSSDGLGYSLLDLITKKAILVEKTDDWTGPLPTDGSYSLNIYALWPKDLSEDFSSTYELGIDAK
jgi:hypothetical protein